MIRKNYLSAMTSATLSTDKDFSIEEDSKMPATDDWDSDDSSADDSRESSYEDHIQKENAKMPSLLAILQNYQE